MNQDKKIPALTNKKIFFLDRDGTLVLGNEKIEGANEFIQHLKNNKKIFYVLTNNSSKTPEQHLKAFKEAGFDLELDNILVSIQPALDFLKEKGVSNLYFVANKAVSGYIEERGFVFDDKNPQALLLTYDNEITYEKLEKMACFIRAKIPYYATHIDLVIPTQKGSLPDIGTFIKVLEITTGVVPEKTFGKSSKEFIDIILKKHGLSYEDAVIVGDRLYTEIKMAQDSAMTSVLVLTGETTKEDYESSDIKADIVVENLNELID